MNSLVAALLALSIVLIQCVIGGTRLVFSLPIYGLLAVTAVACAFRRPTYPARPQIHCLVISIVFFGYILARAAMSEVDYLWWTDFYMVIACLTAYFLTAYYITDQRSRTIVLILLFALAVVETGWGMRQFAGGDNWMPLGQFGIMKGYEANRRATGTLISSIHLAGYLEAVGIIAVSMAVWSTWKTWARIVTGYVALLCYVGVGITGSRGGYLSVAGSIFAFVVLSLYLIKKVRPSRYPVALIGAVILTMVTLSGALALLSKNPFLQQRVEMMFQQFDSTKQKDIRIYNWQAALDQFHTAPIWGTGAGTHIYFGRLYRRAPLQADPIHAHSDYLEMAAEYGVVGLLGIAVFLFAHIRRGLLGVSGIIKREMASLDDWEPMRNTSLALQIGCLSAVAAYLVHSVMDFNLHIPGNALVFAFIFGALITRTTDAQATAKLNLNTKVLRWAVPALGVWMCAVGLPKWPAEYYAEKARVAVRDRDFKAAINAGEKSLRYHQRSPELFFSLGGAYRGAALLPQNRLERRNLLSKAIDAYRKGADIFPYDSHLYVRLGQVLDEAGFFEQAGDAYRDAIAYDPQLSEVYVYYARHLSMVGRQEEAEEYLNRAKSLAQRDLSPIIRGTFLDPQYQNR